MRTSNSLKVLEIDVVCTVCGGKTEQCMSYAHGGRVVHPWRVCRACLKAALDKMPIDVDVVVYPI